MSGLTYTGERLMPGISGKIAIEHLHRYAIAVEFSKGKKVLDIASGEGYGSNLISEYATTVIGIDISEEAIIHSQSTYKKENLNFRQGSALDIPLENSSFDVVISFETLEHISDHQKMMSELKRVLKPDGILIISTPEKAVYSDQENYSNPFHEKELYKEEFINLINLEFKFHYLYFQKYLTGSMILSSHGREGELIFFSGNFKSLQLKESFEIEYMIAVCSNNELTTRKSDSFFIKQEIDNQMTYEKLKKLKSGFRYRLIDFLFKPLDLMKQVQKRI